MADDMDVNPPWEASTSDSFEPEAPGVGEWRLVEDVTDATYREIAAYCKFRRVMRRYVLFVWAGDVLRRLPDNVKMELDALDEMADAFPTASQVLREPRGGEGVIRYHTSYLEWSDSRPFTRSAMLAGWAPVVAKVQSLKQLFEGTMERTVVEPFETLHANVLAAYEAWRAMAEQSMRAAGGLYAHTRSRETGGRGAARRRAEMRGLLERLGAVGDMG